ncbi:MAG: hypothetical protein HQ581_24945 [Planctomycetes bacterium]|nr:hypothetical protein [Planctomycetota bacterium]
MSYRVILGDEAEEKLKTVPNELLEYVREQLRELANDPLAVGRETPSPPYVPIGHIFQFHKMHDEQVHYFTVFFLYADEKDGADADQLNVWDIVISPRFSDVLPPRPSSES